MRLPLGRFGRGRDRINRSEELRTEISHLEQLVGDFASHEALTESEGLALRARMEWARERLDERRAELDRLANPGGLLDRTWGGLRRAARSVGLGSSARGRAVAGETARGAADGFDRNSAESPETENGDQPRSEGNSAGGHRPKHSRRGSTPWETAALETLQVSPDATVPEIRAAYRRLAKVYHPDVAHGGSMESSNAAQRMKELNAAYARLSHYSNVAGAAGA